MNIHINLPSMEDGGVTPYSVYMSARAIVHMPLEMLLSYAEKPTIILELCCQDPVSFKSQTNSIKTLGHDQPQSRR